MFVKAYKESSKLSNYKGLLVVHIWKTVFSQHRDNEAVQRQNVKRNESLTSRDLRISFYCLLV